MIFFWNHKIKNRECVTKIQLDFLVYNKVSLPGDSHVALLLRMTEYFVRIIARVCLLKSNSKIYILSLRYSVQRALCHCEKLLIMKTASKTIKVFMWNSKQTE